MFGACAFAVWSPAGPCRYSVVSSASGTRDTSDAVLARVHCRTFRGSQAGSVLVLVVLSTSTLSMLASLALPIPVLFVLFAGMVGLGIAWLAGPTEYTLTASQVRRLHRRFLGGSPQQRDVALRDLRSWRHDRQLSRSLQEYEFLELDPPHGPRWVITNRQDAAGFAQFAAAFLALVQAPPASSAGAKEPDAAAPVPDQPRPRQRGSFYRSWLGRGVAVLAALAAVGLLGAMFAGQLHFGNVLRLLLVIVPGAVYLCWRSFGRR